MQSASRLVSTKTAPHPKYTTPCQASLRVGTKNQTKRETIGAAANKFDQLAFAIFLVAYVEHLKANQPNCVERASYTSPSPRLNPFVQTC